MKTNFWSWQMNLVKIIDDESLFMTNDLFFKWLLICASSCIEIKMVFLVDKKFFEILRPIR